MTTRAWCCLRLRFDERELALLRGAESIRGAGLAQDGRPAMLRVALNLARLGRKLSGATAGAVVSLEDSEIKLALEALDYAVAELPAVAHADESASTPSVRAALESFPELRGSTWRSFGLTREIETIRDRLRQALES